MQRRTFLRALGAALAVGLMPLPAAGRATSPKTGGELPAIPVLMFHKVDDTPRYPEDISSTQLAALLERLWGMGFHPVNISDILDGTVDRVVPKGLKPVGITADDAHRSVIFSRATARHAEQRNARSLVEIFCDSLKSSGHMPRGTFFLSRVGDDRYSTKPEGYFGDVMPLPEVLKTLASRPGLEVAYHTRDHLTMRGMGQQEVARLLKNQMDDFAALGVADRVVPILAYPYGVPPSPQGIRQLRAMGFKGAVLAYPGTGEGRYTALPPCTYSRGLKTDPFLIPRVCIGAYTYAARGTAGSTPVSPYLPVDPYDDFRKDILHALPRLYVSQGA